MRLKSESIWIIILVIGLAIEDQRVNCEKWEDISIICPHECACQYSHRNDLSVTRWIKGMTVKKNDKVTIDAEANNDAMLDDEGPLKNTENPLVKSATCLLQQDINMKDFIGSLPQDLEVLVILYGGGSSNITIHTSEINSLQDLKTLEIRGSGRITDLQLIFDEPLENLKQANLEAVELLGIEHAKRRPNHQTYNPSDHFDYVPESEKVEYNVSLKIVTDDVQIVPYEVYLMEKKRSKTMTFYGWDSLEILRIHDCKLDELYWEIFDGLESLKHLSLEHNQIKIVPAFAFFGAKQIRTLSLARNEILDLHYRALAGLLDLEELDLSYNNLSKLSEMTFPPFPKLEVLDLRSNPIRFIFPATFGVMNSTKVLYLGAETCALDLNAEDSFEHLNELEELLIINATAESLTSSNLQGLVRLKKFEIRGTLKRVEFDAFADKPRLRELILSHCSIEEISMDTLFGIKNLEVIDLSYNNLQEIPYGLLDEQKHLHEIYLQGNSLTELPRNFFEVLASLKLARLTENPWMCSCDMVSWKQGVTNKIKVMKQGARKCSFGTLGSSKDMTCEDTKPIVEYVYDNKMSPRCNFPETMNGRSVYYSLRKDLRCSTKQYKASLEKKRAEEKRRLTAKFVDTYSQRIAILNPHPLQPKVEEERNFYKEQKQKLRSKNFQNKVENTIMRENNVKKSHLTKYRITKKTKVNRDSNNILNGSA